MHAHNHQPLQQILHVHIHLVISNLNIYFVLLNFSLYFSHIFALCICAWCHMNCCPISIDIFLNVKICKFNFQIWRARQDMHRQMYWLLYRPEHQELSAQKISQGIPPRPPNTHFANNNHPMKRGFNVHSKMELTFGTNRHIFVPNKKRPNLFSCSFLYVFLSQNSLLHSSACNEKRTHCMQFTSIEEQDLFHSLSSLSVCFCKPSSLIRLHTLLRCLLAHFH